MKYVAGFDGTVLYSSHYDHRDNDICQIKASLLEGYRRVTIYHLHFSIVYKYRWTNIAVSSGSSSLTAFLP